MQKALIQPRTLLCLLVVANSGCVFLTDNKLAGVPYLRELFLALVVASALWLLAAWPRPWQSRASLWVLFMGLAMPLMSALGALWHFGQPLGFGLLEERRCFLYLLFFPMLYLLTRAQPSQAQLERWMLYGALACVVVGFGYYSKLIPENASVGFNVDEKDYGFNPLRPDRYSIGISYVSICAMMLMYRLRQRVEVVSLLLLGVFAAYLWLVLQTRNIMLVWALAALWVFRARLGNLAKLGLVALVVGVVAYLLVPSVFDEQYYRLMALIEEASEPGGVRADTTAIILRDSAANWYVGMGALSLQWEGGFARFYSSYFYLSDVGILGVLYRYGLITPLIMLVYFVGYWRIARQCRHKGPLLSAFALDMAFNFINLFFSSSIMYGGDIAGVALAAFVYFGRASATVQASRQPPLPQGARPPAALALRGR